MKTEEKVAHTPGIWKAVAVDESAEYKQWEIQPHVGVIERVDEIGEANARLIAAAPELLAFVENWKLVIDGKGAEGWAQEFDKEAADLISKAKGLPQ
jgi:hypothetical protein